MSFEDHPGFKITVLPEKKPRKQKAVPKTKAQRGREKRSKQRALAKWYRKNRQTFKQDGEITREVRDRVDREPSDD